MTGVEHPHTGSKPAPGDLAYVQGFVNSNDREAGTDAFATPEGLRRWLERYGLIAPGTPVGEDERQRAVAFREAVRALLLAHNGHPLDAGAVATLQDTAAALPLQLRFTASGEARLEPAVAGADGAIARLQTLIYQAMLEGTWERLKACLNDTCQWAFYDASRNRSGTWCTMDVCGNRMKVRAHRQRRATEEEP